MKRRAFLGACIKWAGILPFGLMLTKLAGCLSDAFDVVISKRAEKSGSVLQITKSQLRGVEYGIESNVQGEGLYVYSVNGMWGEWVFEVNGNRITKSADRALVSEGDEIAWRGRFLS